jgi:trehalose 6-phosphate phosphatase
MKYALSQAGQAALATFAKGNVLVAFDYDGTLAPLVVDPARAGMPAETQALLDQVAALYPSAVISGRGRADVCSRLNGAHLRAVAGNHGAELDANARASNPHVGAWLASFESGLAGLEGVEVEDKRLSVSVHYRRAPDKSVAESAILAVANVLPGARIVLGKKVINVVAADAPHKGSALAKIRADVGCDAALYVGDDETDEDVFRTAPGEPLFGVRVGRTARSRAEYYVRHQGEVNALLDALIRIRTSA